MAASNIHLKIGDIKGESTDAKHKDEIDVESWNWGASNPGTTAPGGGGGASRVTFSDLTFTQRFDRASPLTRCPHSQWECRCSVTACKPG